ncbi:MULTISPECIES: hypothetical protein [Bacillus]|uniref:hypothetical protein n=1 Tax=Bacillus TaxID=1386 RepID=UPI00228156C4|nr:MULTISPECIES: hypothetical protein [Bacillus]MCY8180867.1 hypothetical protein [Bacillus paralicheniformis]MCY8664854.1 hypothetical protein [Bacillus haynesii]MCY8712442.1 hypothetical protein [Bacillus haynesii]
MFNPLDWYITPKEYERAAQNGVSKELLERRIRRSGWDKKRAITTPALKRMPLSEWADVAESNGISRKRFSCRINNLGWDEEKAATVPVAETKENMRRAQKKSPRNQYRTLSRELVELAQENGIKYDTLLYRVRKRGMNPHEAATMPARSSAEVARIALSAYLEKYGNTNSLFFQKRRQAN